MRNIFILTSVLAIILFQNIIVAISPDDFTGATDLIKVQAAIDYSIANGFPAIIIDREYDLTGGTITIDKGIIHTESGNNYARKRMTFIGRGVGKILKTDTGFMFSANARAGDIAFENITFSGTISAGSLSSIVSGLKCFDCDKLIRITTTNCTFRYLDYVWYQAGSVSTNMQSVRSVNDMFTKNNIIMHFNQAWDICFLSGLMEDGNQFLTCEDVSSAVRNLIVDNSCIEGMTATAIDLDCIHYGTKIVNNYFEANLNHISMTRSNSGVSISKNAFFGRGSISAATIIKCIEIALGNASMTVTGNLATETNSNTILVSIDTASAFNVNYYRIIGSNETFGATLTDQPTRMFQFSDLVDCNLVKRDYVTTPAGTDMNDYEVNSVKVFDNVPDSTITNQPEGWNGGIVETRGTGNYKKQTAYNRLNAQVFYRSAINSTWTPWVNTSAALSASLSYNPPSIPNGGCTARELTVTGAAMGDFAIASFSLDVRDLQLNAQVTAADTVTCTFTNNCGQAIDLGTGTLRVKIIKK